MVSCYGCCGNVQIADDRNLGLGGNNATRYPESPVTSKTKSLLDAYEKKVQWQMLGTEQVQDATNGTKNRFSHYGTFVNVNSSDANVIRHEAGTSAPYLISRKKKCFYNVRFPSRPLYIKLASSYGSSKDAYIIEIDNKCPVSDAHEAITIESKVIYINGKLVEGCDLREISRCVRSAKLPIRLTLVGPEHLSYDETPDHTPEIVQVL